MNCESTPVSLNLYVAGRRHRFSVFTRASEHAAPFRETAGTAEHSRGEMERREREGERESAKHHTPKKWSSVVTKGSVVMEERVHGHPSHHRSQAGARGSQAVARAKKKGECKE